MPSISPAVRDLLHEKLDARLAESEQVMDAADHGRTIHNLDDFFGTKGQKFLQKVFQQKLQERIAKNETTAEGKQCPLCKKNDHAKNEIKNDSRRQSARVLRNSSVPHDNR